jgi:serine/threonine-protein kinase
MRETARFCPHCRAPLAASPAPVAGPHCPNCGAPTRPGARFCRHCSHSLTETPPPPPPAQQPGRFGTGELLPLSILAGRYVILEKIAQGGMGAIYKAHDKRLQDKVVAVKEMSESAIAPSERQRVLESFRREAELLARLEHPNLVRVTDRFQDGEHHYTVMEFIEGQTLQKMLKGRSEPFPEQQVLVWADQLCNVLAYLHSQNPKIIYRDVKPANVMVIDGTDHTKLIDFGIVRFYKPGKRRDTIEFGTDGYAPPEQYGRAQTDERSDVYALGAMLHQLLTLREPITRPFHFPPVRSLNPKASRRVEGAIMKAVEANKRKRHQSMEGMRIALLGDGAPQRARPPTPARKGKKRQKPAKPAPMPPHVPGKLVATPAALDFGAVRVGSNPPALSFTVNFPAGEQVALSASAPWMHVHPQTIDWSGTRATVTLNTRLLRPGRLRLSSGWLKSWIGLHTRFLVPAEHEVSAHVELASKSGHRQRVPVSVTIVPLAWQVQTGWIITAGVILLELAAAAFFLGVLLMLTLL